jgi:glycosyltransferase involved in cell wall biosynthesis
MELTILMPCLNEAETLALCISKAKSFITRHHIKGEILIADNGSTDGSQSIALRLGARVINVDEKGYGNTLMGGIKNSRGKYIIMGDSDDSYDFSKLKPFIDKLRQGYDLVMGNRFKGGILPGAMPPLHRYLGNPVLSFIGKIFFKTPCNDFHCGLRGFNKDNITSLNLKHPGMEFASEMVLKSTLQNLKICEVPTTLSPDGRSRPPHLRSWRDGWRHLRLLLICAPQWLFLLPGLLLFLLGIIMTLLILPKPVSIQGLFLDIHSLLYANAFIIIGIQSIYFYIHAKVYATFNEYIPKESFVIKISETITLERSLLCSALLLFASITLTTFAIADWSNNEFLSLDPRETMRLVIPAVSLAIISMNVILNGFFITLLEYLRKQK